MKVFKCNLCSRAISSGADIDHSGDRCTAPRCIGIIESADDIKYKTRTYECDQCHNIIQKDSVHSGDNHGCARRGCEGMLRLTEYVTPPVNPSLTKDKVPSVVISKKAGTIETRYEFSGVEGTELLKLIHFTSLDTSEQSRVLNILTGN